MQANWLKKDEEMAIVRCTHEDRICDVSFYVDTATFVVDEVSHQRAWHAKADPHSIVEYPRMVWEIYNALRLDDLWIRITDAWMRKHNKKPGDPMWDVRTYVRDKYCRIIGAALSPFYHEFAEQYMKGNIVRDAQRRAYSLNGRLYGYADWIFDTIWQINNIYEYDHNDQFFVEDFMTKDYITHAMLIWGDMHDVELKPIMRDSTMRKSLGQMPHLPTSLVHNVYDKAANGHFPPRVLKTRWDWMVWGLARANHDLYRKSFERSSDQHFQKAYDIMKSYLDIDGRRTMKRMAHAFGVITDVPVSEWPWEGTFVAVAEASKKYHDALERERFLKTQEELEAKERNVYSPPNWELPEGFEFIMNERQLVEEGMEMNHCVGQYNSKVARGTSWIVRYEDEDGRATLEVASNGALIQCQGVRNHDTKSSQRAAREYEKWAKDKFGFIRGLQTDYIWLDEVQDQHGIFVEGVF